MGHTRLPAGGRVPCRPEARQNWGIATMKRHLFTEDTRSFHICLCRHFKVPLTGYGAEMKRKAKNEEVGGLQLDW